MHSASGAPTLHSIALRFIAVAVGGAGALCLGACSVTLDPILRVDEETQQVGAPSAEEPAPVGTEGDGGGGTEDAGNDAPVSGEDSSAPFALELVATSPATGETGVATDTDIQLVFDRNIALLAGSFTLYRMLDGGAFESIAISSPSVAVDGATLTIDLDGVLAESTVYTIALEANAIEGTDGGVFEGVAAVDAISFTTGAVTLPGAVTDGLLLWLDATFASGIKMAEGVAVWGDRSGNNSTVKQPALMAQPSLIEAAINSKAVVRFDGSSDVLEGPVLDVLEAYEVFVVWQSPLEPPTLQTHLLRNGPTFEVNHGHNQTLFRYAAASQIAETWISAQFERPVTNTPYVWNLSLDSTAATLTAFTNGIATTTTNLLGTPNASGEPLTIGSRWDLSRHFSGDIGEILLYRRALTAGERTAVQSYLDEKWGL